MRWGLLVDVIDVELLNFRGGYGEEGSEDEGEKQRTIFL